MSSLLRVAIPLMSSLLLCVAIPLMTSPLCVLPVNSRDPETGASLLQFVISNANRARLLGVLLDAKCRIALQADARGRTCLHQVCALPSH